jgi:hypothetical protein
VVLVTYNLLNLLIELFLLSCQLERKEDSLRFVLILWILTVEPTVCKLVMSDWAPVPLVAVSKNLRNVPEDIFLTKVFRSRSLEKV